MILKSVRIVPTTALSIIPSAEPMGWLATTMNGPSWGILSNCCGLRSRLTPATLRMCAENSGPLYCSQRSLALLTLLNPNNHIDSVASSHPTGPRMWMIFIISDLLINFVFFFFITEKPRKVQS